MSDLAEAVDPCGGVNQDLELELKWIGERNRNASRIDEATWDRYKFRIIRLYQAGKLKSMMATMQDVYHFKASKSQYISKLIKWGVRKNLKNGPGARQTRNDSLRIDTAVPSPRDVALHDCVVAEIQNGGSTDLSSDTVAPHCNFPRAIGEQVFSSSARARTLLSALPALPALSAHRVPELLNLDSTSASNVIDPPTPPKYHGSYGSLAPRASLLLLFSESDVVESLVADTGALCDSRIWGLVLNERGVYSKATKYHHLSTMAEALQLYHLGDELFVLRKPGLARHCFRSALRWCLDSQDLNTPRIDLLVSCAHHISQSLTRTSQDRALCLTALERLLGVLVDGLKTISELTAGEAHRDHVHRHILSLFEGLCDSKTPYLCVSPARNGFPGTQEYTERIILRMRSDIEKGVSRQYFKCLFNHRFVDRHGDSAHEDFVFRTTTYACSLWCEQILLQTKRRELDVYPGVTPLFYFLWPGLHQHLQKYGTAPWSDRLATCPGRVISPFHTFRWTCHCIELLDMHCDMYQRSVDVLIALSQQLMQMKSQQFTEYFMSVARINSNLDPIRWSEIDFDLDAIDREFSAEPAHHLIEQSAFTLGPQVVGSKPHWDSRSIISDTFTTSSAAVSDLSDKIVRDLNLSASRPLIIDEDPANEESIATTAKLLKAVHRQKARIATVPLSRQDAKPFRHNRAN